MAGRLVGPNTTPTIYSKDPSTLPPVDVLMVWHSHMLNPRAYLEDCLRNGQMHMWRTALCGKRWRTV